MIQKITKPAAIAALIFAIVLPGQTALAASNFLISPHACKPRSAVDDQNIRVLPNGLLNVSRTRNVVLLCGLSEQGLFGNQCNVAVDSHQLAAAFQVRPALSGATIPRIWLFLVSEFFPNISPAIVAGTQAAGIPDDASTRPIVKTAAFARIDCDAISSDFGRTATAMILLPPFTRLDGLAYTQIAL